MTQHDPFRKPRKAPKPRVDREYKDGRQYLADKSELRRIVFERSGGRCEAGIGALCVGTGERCDNHRCQRPITLKSMELSHKNHGQGFRDDSAEGTIASCKECHQEGRHGSKCTYRRRPGKVMTSAKAKAYWMGAWCFCDGVKDCQSSFCNLCLEKLSDQSRHDLGLLKGKPWLEALAAAEIELMKAEVEAKR